MEAIILAGGFGTRLRSVVNDVPKPMAPINGHPFLYYLVENLIKKGFDHIIFAVGYKKEFIEDFFKDNYKGVKISYSEENEPLGTGGCIKQALTYAIENHVWVLNGDTYVDFDFQSPMYDIDIVLKEMCEFDRYGEVKVNEKNVITNFMEKKYCDKGYINTGIYYFPKNIFDDVELSSFSLETDFFTKKIDELKMHAIYTKGYFIDIGIPEDYKKAFEVFHE